MRFSNAWQAQANDTADEIKKRLRRAIRLLGTGDVTVEQAMESYAQVASIGTHYAEVQKSVTKAKAEREATR